MTRLLLSFLLAASSAAFVLGELPPQSFGRPVVPGPGAHVGGSSARATALPGTPAFRPEEGVARATSIPSTGGAVVSDGEKAHGAGSPVAPRALVVPRGEPRTVVRDEQDVTLAVVEAAREFGVDAAVLLCVARAESTLRVNVLGHAGERGPMQFLQRTWGYFDRLPDGTARWTGNAARLGYVEADVWRAIPAARVAAEMFSRRQAWQWSTAKACGGDVQ